MASETSAPPVSLNLEPGSSRVDIKTGFSCNNRCLFCVQGEKRHEYGDKSFDELLSVLDEAREYADQIVFTGGEVTIRKDLPDLVRHARDIGFSLIQIQTNGRMLAVEAALDRLIDAGATEFSPAVHGPDAATHDALTQAPGSFRQTIKGIRNVKARGLPVLLNSVITRANYRALPAMARMFVKLGVDQYQFAFVHPLGSAGARFEEVVPRLSAAAVFALRALESGRAAGVRCMTEAIPRCFLPGYESFAAEWHIPRTRIFDAEWVIEDYTQQRWSHGKVHGPPCRGCAWERMCEGPWSEYPAHYGWDEFRRVEPDEQREEV